MSNANLFVIATRKQFRFPSEIGDLTTEQLWELPLTSRRGANLNAVAIAVNTALKGLAEESFVGNTNDPRRREFEDKLEVVKFIIAVKQEEQQAAQDRLALQETRRQLQEAIAAQEGKQLLETPLEDLKAKLAAIS
jgi:hypothetical protein